MAGSRHKAYTVSKSSEGVRQKKKEERLIKKAHNQEKRNTYLHGDQSLGSWKIQLNKLGLEIRDIPGDGNCLFRALSDQLDGSTENHLHYRALVCDYMMQHQMDFAPFVSDDIAFDKYISQLRKPGTFAGNDALVAFARLQKVDIVIHQLESAALQIPGSGTHDRELHLSYHNGEHYSSVRRIGDRTGSPANIRLKQTEGTKGFEKHAQHDATIEGTKEIMTRTNCKDSEIIIKLLKDYDNDIEAVIDCISCMNMVEASTYPDERLSPSQIVEHGGSTSTLDSGMWSDRSSDGVAFSVSAGVESRKENGAQKDRARLSKRNAKQEKKKRAEERRKKEFTNITSDFITPDEAFEVTGKLATLTV